MKKTKVLLQCLVFFGILRLFGIQTQAEEVSVLKSALPYEILSIETTQTTMIIKGWALISYVQHFQNDSDHTIQLEFISIQDHFKVDAMLEPISQTSMMQYFGSPTCSLGSINSVPETCNYVYENVGFRAEIPLSRFIAMENYQTNIIVHAYLASLSYKTPLYYPISQDISFRIAEKEYRIVSKLDDTQLKVSATTVIARKEPYKTSPAWYSGANCSTTYTNQLFFMKDSIYTNIKQKLMVGNTSYYRVSANPYLCYASRRRIVEGTNLDPVWIASPYVLYSGSPLQIQVIRLNNLPIINAGTLEIYEGESINIMEHVSAFDVEDGDITSKITILSNSIQSSLGNYKAELSVVDSFGSIGYGTFYVNVITRPNFVPIIDAADKTILQFSIFDPIKDVSASDHEDGDLTTFIEVMGQVDTNTLGIQPICYRVEDSKQSEDNICINVEVIDYTRYSNKFRFISKNRLFYLETIPSNWITNFNMLINLLNNTDSSVIIEINSTESSN